ncbi:MAG: hypothetical protein AAFN00_21870, partial [Cyanobacteria bacterium J06558_2]
MKRLKISFLGIIFPLYYLLCPNIANAQAKVFIEEKTLTVFGFTRNTKAKHQVYLELDKSLKNFEISVSERPLYTDNKRAVFPTDAITLEQTPNEANQSDERIIPLTFDFSKAPQSGEFTGKLKLNYKYENNEGQIVAGKDEILLTLKIKDPWFLPLTILFIGTALGISVSNYRAKGKPRDEIIVREGELRYQMQIDA